jgi:hypothetical protein
MDRMTRETFRRMLAPVRNPSRPMRVGEAAAARVVRSFTGRPAARIRPLRFHRPRALAKLGRARAIVYESNKWDGKARLYKHDFSKGTQLFADEKGRGQLYIRGPRVAVQRRGIVG